MNTFSWFNFVQRYNLEFKEGGASTAKNNIYVKCPFCLGGDKMLMGLSLDGTSWGCWRKEEHRGIKPQRLIVALIRCSWDQANAIVGEQPPSQDSWDGMKELLVGKKTTSSTIEALKFPSEFKEIKKDDAWFRYLKKRGFDDPQEVAGTYGLKRCMIGRFSHRLILPFFHHGALVGWSARAISKARIRYLSHPTSDVPKRILFNSDEAEDGGRALVIVEGPLDTLKVDWYGQFAGIRAVGLLGLQLNSEKVVALMRLAPRYDKVFIALDAGALAQAVEFSSKLASINPSIAQMPRGVDDPGAMNEEQVLGTFVC